MLFEGVDVPTQQRAKSHTMPSPIGGLNGRDSLANMPETDAYELVNVIPGTSTCEVRPGCGIHQTGLGGPVASLGVFASGEENKLLGFAKPSVWEITEPGIKTAIKSDLNSDEVVSCMFSTVADMAQWLIITTGADTPMSFNGTALADLVLTGFIDPVVNINYVINYKLRLFFATNDRLGFYYLPPGQIQGALEWYDLGQVSIRGGYLQAIGTYSNDGGDGPDDYIVFLTSRGEVIVFNGYDPGDPTAWELVGRYRSAAPLGRKSVVGYAGDLLILTHEGVQQLSKLTKLSDTNFSGASISDKLGDILYKHNIYYAVLGWDMELWPSAGLLIVNVPDSPLRTGPYKQYVMNTITQAWAVFDSREWDALCLAQHNAQTYFGRYDGSVRVVGGLYDNNKPISFIAKQAYNYFGTPRRKHFKWATFLFKSNAPVSVASRLSVDYVESIPITPPSPAASGGGATWDVAYWDIESWGVASYTQRWIAPYANYGVVASHWLQGQLGGASLEWYATEHVYEEAQGLL